MANFIVSPYFAVNTQLVANMCRNCYSQEEEEEDVVVTSVNITFLKNFDPKQYLVFINSFNFIPQIKSEVTSNDAKEFTISNYNQTSSSKQTIIQMKQRIINKYTKINFKRQYFEVSPSNRNTRKKLKQINKENNETNMKQEYCIDNMESSQQISKGINKLLLKETMEQEEMKTNIKNETHIKSETRDKTEEKQYNKKENILHDNFKYEKIVETKWIPPISPHNLIEEKYYYDPWALLVVTIFLNRTSCFLALPHMEQFFDDFKGPYDVLKVEACRLESYFTKIGLIKTRANQVWRMSFDYVHKDWKHVGELYGVGKYAQDAYRMFHLGDFNVEPTDRYLKIYKAWYEMKKSNEKLGIRETNSQIYLEDYFIAPEDEDRTEEAVETN